MLRSNDLQTSGRGNPCQTSVISAKGRKTNCDMVRNAMNMNQMQISAHADNNLASFCGGPRNDKGLITIWPLRAFYYRSCPWPASSLQGSPRRRARASFARRVSSFPEAALTRFGETNN